MSDADNSYDSVPEPFETDVDPDVVKSSAMQKQEERDELSQQIDQFLAAGGKINYVDAHVLADPPKKPTSNYGSQPI